MSKKARFYRKMRRKYSMNSIEFKKFKIECEKELIYDVEMIAKNKHFALAGCFIWRDTADGIAFWTRISSRCKK